MPRFLGNHAFMKCVMDALRSRQGRGQLLVWRAVAGSLRKAIPAHCFERSLKTSFAYLGTDLAAVAALYFASTFFSHPAVPAAVRWGLLWPAYWFLQGAVCTGLWVIAHECGHQVAPAARRCATACLGCSCRVSLVAACGI